MVSEQDMETLMDWFKANKLTLNLDKTACILFKKNGLKQEIELEIEGTIISSQKDPNFLGLWLDNHLNWPSHLNKLFIKLKRNKSLLRLRKGYLNELARKLFSYRQSFALWFITVGKQYQ